MRKLILTPYESIVHEECTTTNYGLNFEGSGSFGYVEYSPFGNCQIYSVAQAREILSYDIDVAIQAFKDIFLTVRKNQMMIDIPSYFQGQADEVFKGYITFKTPYTNTTGSEMIVYLINMKKFYYEEEKIESPDEYLLTQLFEKWKENGVVVEVSANLMQKYSTFEIINTALAQNNVYLNIINYKDITIEEMISYCKRMFSPDQQKRIKFNENIEVDLIIDSRTGYNGVNAGIELLLQLIERIKQHESI